MLKKAKLACVISWPLAICGCQSLSTEPPLPARVVTVGCEKPPAPQAWFMEPFEPTLTQHMLNELSESPTKGIED